MSFYRVVTGTLARAAKPGIYRRISAVSSAWHGVARKYHKLRGINRKPAPACAWPVGIGEIARAGVCRRFL